MNLKVMFWNRQRKLEYQERIHKVGENMQTSCRKIPGRSRIRTQGILAARQQFNQCHHYLLSRIYLCSKTADRRQHLRDVLLYWIKILPQIVLLNRLETALKFLHYWTVKLDLCRECLHNLQ